MNCLCNLLDNNWVLLIIIALLLINTYGCDNGCGCGGNGRGGCGCGCGCGCG